MIQPQKPSSSDPIAKLPFDEQAERAVLGAILRNGDHMMMASELLDSSYFFKESHRHIFSSQLDLYKNNEGIDVVTVSSALQSNVKARNIGPAYLVELTENCPVTQNIEHYAQIVRKTHFLRRIIQSSHDAIVRAQNHQESVEGFIESLEKEFLEISNQHDKAGLVKADVVIESTIEQIQKNIEHEGEVTGVPTGFIGIDNLIGGWQNSDLTIVAARPGMGKTALMLNFMMHAVHADKKVAFFTLEMSKEQLMSRVLSTEARVDSMRLRRGDLNEEETDRLMDCARKIYAKKDTIGIDETPALSILELRSRCRRYKKENGLDLIIVDYLQLMVAGGARREASREREISEISMGLKSLAKELNVPVITGSQLNRGPDARPDKRPKMSDLRESGSIEQDADMIMMIYRDEVYNPNSERAGIAEVIVGKNRHGSTKTIDLAYQPNFVSFHNLISE